MMKIRWLSNGLYSLKNCHKQFGQAFRPPPPFWAMPKFTRFFLGGASLSGLRKLRKLCTPRPNAVKATVGSVHDESDKDFDSFFYQSK